MPLRCYGPNGGLQPDDRERLRRPGYLRSGDEILTVHDLPEYESLPENATLQQRCERAALLKMKYSLDDIGEYQSTYFWYEHISALNNETVSEWAENEYDAMVLAEQRNKGRRRWRDRSSRKPQRNARKRWRKVRAFVRLRGVAMFWWGCTQATLCAEGGKGRADDYEAYMNLWSGVGASQGDALVHTW